MKRDVEVTATVGRTIADHYCGRPALVKTIPLRPSMAKGILARAENRGRHLPLELKRALQVIAARDMIGSGNET